MMPLGQDWNIDKCIKDVKRIDQRLNGTHCLFQWLKRYIFKLYRRLHKLFMCWSSIRICWTIYVLFSWNSFETVLCSWQCWTVKIGRWKFLFVFMAFCKWNINHSTANPSTKPLLKIFDLLLLWCILLANIYTAVERLKGFSS